MADALVRRGAISNKVGLEVSDLNVTLVVNPLVLRGNTPLALFAADGGFDGATLVVQRFFSANWSSAQDVALSWPLLLFAGQVAEVDVTASEIDMVVKSHAEQLNRPLPRNVHMASCINTVYDATCALFSGNFAVSANVANGSTPLSILTDLAESDGYFDLGVITFTSGENNGVVRTVASYANSQVSVVPRLLVAPSSGDTFTVVPGCNKSLVACNSKFNNLEHFRGFPFIPTPETSL